MIEYIVTEDDDNSRADRIIKKISGELGFVAIQKIFRTNKIKVNGKKIAPSERLNTGDNIKIFANLSLIVKNPLEKNPVLLEQLKKMIVFENDDFFAINKPTKLAVQPGTKVAICVETFIKAFQANDERCECHLVHRLDKDTSGVLLIAKNKQTAKKITALFRENKIQKTYFAVVNGLIKSGGIIDNFVAKTFVGNEEKMTVSEIGQRAITEYKPVKTIGQNTLLELKPKTGRKHQLRVHCADCLNAPILGDKKYNKSCSHNELFLHAYKIQIKEWKIEITADIPSYFPAD